MPTCEYCNKTFSRQKTLDIHMCEAKRRWSQKDNKVHVLAFEIFRRFYEINYNNQKEKNYTDFVKNEDDIQEMFDEAETSWNKKYN